MGRRKKKQKVIIFCYYCDRVFDNEQVLILHQRSRHFKCPECHKKISSAQGMMEHVYQVHRETIEKVPHAKEGRDSFDVVIFGMAGVPADLIEQRRQKIYGEPAPKKQKVNQQGMVAMNPHMVHGGRSMMPGMPGQPMGMMGMRMPAPGIAMMPGQPMMMGAPMPMPMPMASFGVSARPMMPMPMPISAASLTPQTAPAGAPAPGQQPVNRGPVPMTSSTPGGAAPQPGGPPQQGGASAAPGSAPSMAAPAPAHGGGGQPGMPPQPGNGAFGQMPRAAPPPNAGPPGSMAGAYGGPVPTASNGMHGGQPAAAAAHAPPVTGAHMQQMRPPAATGMAGMVAPGMPGAGQGYSTTTAASRTGGADAHQGGYGRMDGNKRKKIIRIYEDEDISMEEKRAAHRQYASFVSSGISNLQGSIDARLASFA